MSPWEKISFFASNRTPFLCIINFKATQIEVIPLNTLYDDIRFSIDGENKRSSSINLTTYPIAFSEYGSKFEIIQDEIRSGNTYLLNLTQPTKIEINGTLKEIYEASDAKFKLLYKDQFVCFSPERFIKIKDNKIFTYPMKGTIDARVSNAEKIILNNQKEMAEHTMVVDLLRNDLSIVASKVRVEKFRYIDKIKAGNRELLQVSSEICGDLSKNWRDNLGQILQNLLPAGSISGTPKKESLRIIDEVEGYDRGFFSGIFGVFDGENFDSGVMIRFIEKEGENYFYKSGGGITLDSDAKLEYQEMLDKIYIADVK